MMNDKTEKKLRGIVPFNRYLFRTCFYHQILACYARWGVDPRWQLWNYLPVYRFEAATGRFCFDFWPVLDECEVTKRTGIRLRRRDKVNDFIAEAIRCIDRGIPVIVAVDTYYLPYRQDCYQRSHIPHFILIYGYDLRDRTFTVSEHMYLNSNRYSEMKQSMRGIAEAYYSYCDDLHASCGGGFVEVRRVGAPQRSPDPAVYAKLYFEQQDAVRESLRQLELLFANLRCAVADPVLFRRQYQGLIDSLGEIRARKHAQTEQMRAVFANDDLTRKLSRVENVLVFIFGMLVRMYATDYYSETSVARVHRSCDEVLELEREYHRFLIEGRL